MFKERCLGAIAPLRRRIFLWFGVSIALAGSLAAATVHLLPGAPEYRRDAEGLAAFGANRFAEVWERPAERRKLAEDLARQLRVDITVLDPTGAVVEVVGDGCHDERAINLKPERDGMALGTVQLCRAVSSRRPLSWFSAAVVGLLVLWMVSMRIASRIGRPIERLVVFANGIGKGSYDDKVLVSRHAPLEIHRLRDALADMARKIKRQMHDQRELLASVSHEVRSPLARIRLLTEFLKDEDRPERRAKLMADLEQEIEEIDDLVGGLLASSRVDFSALSLRPHDLESLAARALERAGLQVELAVTGDARQIACDPTLLARALANLLDNAQRHGGGATSVQVSFEEDRAVLSVTDAGPGIKAADLPRIFDSFYGKPQGGSESLGLGLSLVKRIAQAHGGDTFAELPDDGGACVGLWLPSATASAPIGRGDPSEGPRPSVA